MSFVINILGPTLAGCSQAAEGPVAQSAQRQNHRRGMDFKGSFWIGLQFLGVTF